MILIESNAIIIKIWIIMSQNFQKTSFNLGANN